MELNKFTTAFVSVCDWNSKRYEREYNHELSVNLILEEYLEFLEAKDNEVEKLDAIADIQFVALGCLWKLGKEQLDFTEANALTNTLLQTGMPPICNISSLIASFNNYDTGIELDTFYMIIFNLCSVQAQHELGLDNEQIMDALLAVCKSNNTKSIKKTASDVKANDGDKGTYYVPPTKNLKKILE